MLSFSGPSSIPGNRVSTSKFNLRIVVPVLTTFMLGGVRRESRDEKARLHDI
jgi:hypothetical protein